LFERSKLVLTHPVSGSPPDLLQLHATKEIPFQDQKNFNKYPAER